MASDEIENTAANAAAGQAHIRACLGTETFVADAARVEPRALEHVKILLIGNYAPDDQESMQRYAELLQSGLLHAGHEVAFAAPRKMLNIAGRPPRGAWKWIGYADKYLMSPPMLSHAARGVDVVHICDHSNSIYVPTRGAVPYVVTCHDLLAVRGALGDDTDCPASTVGRQLQKQILRGLGRAHALACVSTATLQDARRLLNGYAGQIVLAPNALNYPYGSIDRESASRRVSQIPGLGGDCAYVLHVGSNLRRKNRVAAVRAVASVADCWDGRIVFAGQPLDLELRGLARELGIAHRIVDVVKPSNELLDALYRCALALLFPSRFEGFGWPIVEAQACDCPVICSDRDPLAEVSGGAAILCGADDYIAQGRAIVRLATNPAARRALIVAGEQNSRRYSQSTMIEMLLALYRKVGAAT
ncbi:MAG TPA: glycosyltransferase family 1 protein [Steroidobacteraceae bacterium]|nr:glycosyltransferase family 1 protein [Steroidobacteraceae bacterium]